MVTNVCKFIHTLASFSFLPFVNSVYNGLSYEDSYNFELSILTTAMIRKAALPIEMMSRWKLAFPH